MKLTSARISENTEGEQELILSFDNDTRITARLNVGDDADDVYRQLRALFHEVAAHAN